ncbi:hypothetical protein LIER_35142 [Lithospermum erythrorhizon]|uniref:Uncharacterized protein n=1 Tax=Lithospermum erythrorhizon TaxID=34254 RepID=A0AAV3NL77_LITER
MNQGGPECMDKTKIFEVKPLRCLSPVFPSPPGMSSVPNSQASSPFFFVPPSGPFPPGVAPIYPFMESNDRQRRGEPFGNTTSSPVPLNAVRATGSANGGKGRGKRGRPRKVPVGKIGDGGGYSDTMNQSDQYVNDFQMM